MDERSCTRDESPRWAGLVAGSIAAITAALVSLPLRSPNDLIFNSATVAVGGLLAGAQPSVAFKASPLPFFRVQTYGLPQELAHGAVLLLHQPMHLLGHLRGQGEGDGLCRPGHERLLPNQVLSSLTLYHRTPGGPLSRHRRPASQLLSLRNPAGGIQTLVRTSPSCDSISIMGRAQAPSRGAESAEPLGVSYPCTEKVVGEQVASRSWT